MKYSSSFLKRNKMGLIVSDGMDLGNDFKVGTGCAL